MTTRDREPKSYTEEGLLHALRLGRADARPLVFIHGITGSRRYWEKRVLHLARDYRLVIPDLLGFGLSPKPAVDYTILRYSSAVRALLKSEGVAGRRHVLVGHSLGALISLQYAVSHPDDVDALVLISLPRYSSPGEAHDLFFRGSSQYRKLRNEDSVAHTLSQAKRSGLDLFLKSAVNFPWGVLADCRKFTMRSLTSTLEHSLLNYRLDDLLPKLRPLPVLLLHGLRDGVAPLDNIKHLPDVYPFMRLEVIRSSGHHAFLTHSRRCLRSIEGFLSSIDHESEVALSALDPP